jgi:hypothetical protein
MSVKRAAFVVAFCQDPEQNAVAAAIKAGYSKARAPVTACELMHDAEILEAITNKLRRRRWKELAEAPPDKTPIDVAMIVRGIFATIEMADAAGAGAWQANTKVKCYELLGRHAGMFEDRLTVDLDDKLIDQLMLGRKRAAGLLPPAESDVDQKEEIVILEKPDDGKPN